MEQLSLNEVLEKHRKWLINKDDGEKADLRDADLQGADLDYSCLPLWCGGLKIHIDDRIAIQIIYHLLSLVSYSKHVSPGIKELLLTKDIVELGNKFHRLDECGCLNVYKGGSKKCVNLNQ